MLHEPAAKSKPDPASPFKTRLGVWMFILYCLVYAGFVFANVFTEGRAMQEMVFGGLNLAVVYGIGLIVFALLLAVVYNHLCTSREKRMKRGRLSGTGVLRPMQYSIVLPFSSRPQIPMAVRFTSTVFAQTVRVYGVLDSQGMSSEKRLPPPLPSLTTFSA